MRTIHSLRTESSEIEILDQFNATESAKEASVTAKRIYPILGWFCLITMTGVGQSAPHLIAVADWASDISAVNDTAGRTIEAPEASDLQDYSYTARENDDRPTQRGHIDLRSGKARIELILPEQAVVPAKADAENASASEPLAEGTYNADSLSLQGSNGASIAQQHLEPPPGDAPAEPGPLANDLSGSTRPADVKAAMRRVANWQLARVQNEFSQDWTFATLYLGMVTASETLHDPRYAEIVRGVAQHYDWHLGPRKQHADDQAIGQSYLWFYSREHNPVEIAPMRAQFDEVMRLPDDPQKPVWWWCDALFMAPPVWTQLSAATGDRDYLNYMERQWQITSKLLWDPHEHLFFRDKSYFDKREKNGRKVFWSRGNGWVMGGLARMLTYLPKSDPHRRFYVTKFRQMAATVRAIQGEDGLWRPGLLDAADYPYPEVSGSSFFVYALAWGVNSGLLDRATYQPVVEKGWRGLVKHIYQDGRLGDIQPIGAAPGEYKPSSSYVFGTGAFLLAGSEVVKLHERPSVEAKAKGVN